MDKNIYSLKAATTALRFSPKVNRVVRYFPDTDMRCYHDGLRKLAKSAGFDPWTMAPGEFLVFANKRKNRIKIYAPGNIVAYMRSPDLKAIDLDVIRQIPRFFNGKTFDFDQATKAMLETKMRKAA